MRKRADGGLHVDIFPVDGPGFLTIEPDDPGWVNGFDLSRFATIVFLRLRVPDTLIGIDIKDIRASFPSFLDIQVIARAHPQVVLEQAETRYEDKGIRETVETMTREANSKDHAALEVLVQRTLVEVQL